MLEAWSCSEENPSKIMNDNKVRLRACKELKTTLLSPHTNQRDRIKSSTFISASSGLLQEGKSKYGNKRAKAGLPQNNSSKIIIASLLIVNVVFLHLPHASHGMCTN